MKDVADGKGGSGGSRLRRRPDVLVRTTFDRVMLLVPGCDDVVELPGTAREIWESFDHEHSVGDVAALLADRYRWDVAAVQSDVEKLAARLVEHGLLLGEA